MRLSSIYAIGMWRRRLLSPQRCRSVRTSMQVGCRRRPWQSGPGRRASHPAAFMFQIDRTAVSVCETTLARTRLPALLIDIRPHLPLPLPLLLLLAQRREPRRSLFAQRSTPGPPTIQQQWPLPASSWARACVVRRGGRVCGESVVLIQARGQRAGRVEKIWQRARRRGASPVSDPAERAKTLKPRLVADHP